MKTIPLANCDLVAVVDDEDFEWLGRHKWHRAKKWKGDYYARTSMYAGKLNGQHQTDFRYMHRMILGAKKGQLTDHKDGNGLNNRRKNIRLCTPSQNSRNSKPHSDAKTTHGFKGIYLSKKFKPPRYVAQIKVKRGSTKKRSRGFHTPEEAARAYDTLARQHFGEFAWLNFP
jgi:hypothetical protein